MFPRERNCLSVWTSSLPPNIAFFAQIPLFLLLHYYTSAIALLTLFAQAHCPRHPNICFLSCSVCQQISLLLHLSMEHLVSWPWATFNVVTNENLKSRPLMLKILDSSKNPRTIQPCPTFVRQITWGKQNHALTVGRMGRILWTVYASLCPSPCFMSAFLAPPTMSPRFPPLSNNSPFCSPLIATLFTSSDRPHPSFLEQEEHNGSKLTSNRNE